MNPSGFIAVQANIDCKGLYDSIVSPVVGSLTDMSMQLYLIAVRESMRIGPLSELCWVETKDMLVDAQTKWMDDVLWSRFYTSSNWIPANATGTRRIDRGQLQKFTKAMLKIRYAYNSKYNPDDLFEFESMTTVGLVHKHLLTALDYYSDICYIR